MRKAIIGFFRNLVVQYIIAVLALSSLTYAGLAVEPLNNFLTSNVQVWVVVLLLAAVAVSGYTFIRRMRHKKPSAEEFPLTSPAYLGVHYETHWFEHGQFIWKIGLRSVGSTVSISRIDPPMCKECRAEFLPKQKDIWEFLSPPFKWKCPKCSNSVFTQDNSDIIRMEVRSLVQSEIDNGRIFSDGSAIRWKR